MRRVFLGAALVVAGIAAVIVAYSEHRAAYTNIEGGPSPLGGGLSEEEEHLHSVAHPATGLSQLAFTLIRIGGATLVVVGVVLIVIGLIGYWGAQRRESTQGV